MADVISLHGDEEPPALMLSSEDSMHLWGLVEAAENALPGSTDDDATRAVLRAIKDFLQKVGA